MTNNSEIADEIADLNLDEGEDDLVEAPVDAEEEVTHHYEYALIGTFLTRSVIYLEAMRNNLAEYWKPEYGVEISELGDNRYLFEFQHEVDLCNVLDGGPYHFNNHLLVFKRIEEKEDPAKVPLIYSNMWVQIHDLPVGSYSEGMAKVLGNFIGKYIDYDAKAIARGNRDYMRIRVRIDVRLPLKRKKKVAFGRGKEGYVTFRYEKLTLFCFLCGTLGHHDRSCPRRFQPGGRDLPLEWGIELRATVKKMIAVSPYLRIGGVPVTAKRVGPNLMANDIPKNKEKLKGLDNQLANYVEYKEGDMESEILGDLSAKITNKDNITPMEHDAEDEVAKAVDLKKRARMDSAAQVSVLDSSVATTGLSQAQQLNLSAGLVNQARRSQ